VSVYEDVATSVGTAFVYAVSLRPTLGSAVLRVGHPEFAEAGVARRAREAMYAAGITEFGAGLERLAVRVVSLYDTASLEGPLTAGQALAATEDGLPRGHDAVEPVVESPQLSCRPIPPSARTFVAAAQDVVARAMAEVVARVHAEGPRREPDITPEEGGKGTCSPNL
jgi:hypothetical protein